MAGARSARAYPAGAAARGKFFVLGGFNATGALRKVEAYPPEPSLRTQLGVQANTPPTADFPHTCDAADCSFTSTSSDLGPGNIAAWAWDFGDGATSSETNPSHTYTVTAPAEFTVTLTVTDDELATDTETKTITVAPANTAPTADFTSTCHATDCTFTSTSSDAAPGTVVAWAWDFGDGGSPPSSSS